MPGRCRSGVTIHGKNMSIMGAILQSRTAYPMQASNPYTRIDPMGFPSEVLRESNRPPFAPDQPSSAPLRGITVYGEHLREKAL